MDRTKEPQQEKVLGMSCIGSEILDHVETREELTPALHTLQKLKQEHVK